MLPCPMKRFVTLSMDGNTSGLNYGDDLILEKAFQKTISLLLKVRLLTRLNDSKENTLFLIQTIKHDRFLFKRNKTKQ